MKSNRTDTGVAVFLDRDGTLMEERDYPSRPDQVKLLPGAADAVRRLREAGFACVVVTNQSGVGRGRLTLDNLHAVNAELKRQLADHGARLDGLYYCTEAPAGDDPTCIEHPDRKPGPGMLQRASRDLKLNLSRCYMVGDSLRDVLAGRNAGCRAGLLVRTGHDVAAAIAYLGGNALVFDDLSAAAEWILLAGRASDG